MTEISKTADQALAVLVYVSEHGPVHAAQVCSALELNRTVVHRLLTTLHRRGFVARQPDGYAPGALLLNIADRAQPALRRAAHTTMEQLSAELSETIVLHVPDADEVVLLHQIVPDGRLVRVQRLIGTRSPMVQGASGRAILAFLPEPIAGPLMAAHVATGLADLVAKVRERGYAVSHDELQDGVHGLAVPIRDESGDVIASMAMVVPVSRAAGLAEHRQLLLSASRQISETLRTQG
jgi:IclR family KDG regulon transcriptional repressor